MDRRNFLAFIPTLSAIPFIGKEIVKTESGILLPDAKPHIITESSPAGSILDLEVRLFANGKHVGQAFITDMQFENSLETTCRDEPYKERQAKMEIRCIVVDPDQLMKGMYGK